MEKQDEVIQQVIGDLAVLRRAIERAEGSAHGVCKSEARPTHLYLQFGAALLSGILLAAELVTGGGLTASFIYSKANSQFMFDGLVNTACTLIVLCAGMYAVIRMDPRRTNQSIDEYIANNFVYLKNLSLYSDLLVKFLLFCMVILSGKPEWVASLFMLFTGDYLLQGRFFILPLKVSLLLGIICVAAAVALFQASIALVSIPLAVFLGVSLLSGAWLLMSGTNRKEEEPGIVAAE